jgi:hypothetical protein
MPFRLSAHGLKSLNEFHQFIDSKQFKGEDYDTYLDRVFKEEFLVPALYRDLIL